MSRMADFVNTEIFSTMLACRRLIEASRKNLEMMSKSKQKDGADSEALTVAFRQLNKVEKAL